MSFLISRFEPSIVEPDSNLAMLCSVEFLRLVQYRKKLPPEEQCQRFRRVIMVWHVINLIADSSPVSSSYSLLRQLHRHSVEHQVDNFCWVKIKLVYIR